MDRSAASTRVKHVPSVVDREHQLVSEAIAMVASGAATRVVVASLRRSAELLDPARRMALESGVRIVVLWRNDGAGADLAVEPIYE